MYHHHSRACATLLSFLVAGNLQASLEKLKKEDSSFYSFVKNSGVGGLAGMGEALANQPVILIKNQLQQGKSAKEIVPLILHNLRENPREIYRGLGINLLCMGPATAFQIGVDGQLKCVLPGQDPSSVIVRNSITGIASGLVCNFSELVIINQQNSGLSAKHTIKNLYGENGSKVFMRGVVAKAGRDTLFVNGFLTGYPQTQHYLEQSMHPSLAVIAATLLVAPPTALISHPFDTISTRMQADPSQKIMKGFFDAFRLIMKEKGAQGFFSGAFARMARILIAIPLMNGIKNGLNDYVK